VRGGAEIPFLAYAREPRRHAVHELVSCLHGCPWPQGPNPKPNSRVHHSWGLVDAPLRKATVYIHIRVQMLWTVMMLAGMSGAPLARGLSGPQ